MSEYETEDQELPFEDPDPVCVCGENLRGHTYDHNFVDAAHYYAKEGGARG